MRNIAQEYLEKNTSFWKWILKHENKQEKEYALQQLEKEITKGDVDYFLWEKQDKEHKEYIYQINRKVGYVVF